MTQEEQKNTNWSQSVAGVAIRDGKVLLARHTYGSGKGKLIVPGGYLLYGELPQEAVAREFREETGMEVEAARLVGIRFAPENWYAVFSVRVLGGEERPDGGEISEIVWMDVDEALRAEDVPELTKRLIECAGVPERTFGEIPYRTKHERNVLFGAR